jgi:hypothetical protein
VLEVVPGGAVLDASHFATFQQAYNRAAAGDTIQIDHGATLGAPGDSVTVGKRLTIQGDPRYAPAPVAADVEVTPGAAGLVFQNFDFRGPDGLHLDPGARQVTVQNSVIDVVRADLGTGAGNAGVVLSGNTITGGALLNGDVTTQTADQVTGNHFLGSASLYLLNNNGAVVQGNTFDLSQVPDQYAAISVLNSAGVQVRDNVIHMRNATSATAAINLWEEPAHQGKTSVTLSGNTLDTGGRGTGLNVFNEGAADAMTVKVQDNDFRANAVGASLWGQGGPPGTIDLGGGALGSTGQNKFQGFTTAAAAGGRFAIALHGTDAASTVFARGNSWSESDPYRVVKDSAHNTAVADLGTRAPGLADDGTGHIDLGVVLRLPWPGNPDLLARLLGEVVYVPLHLPDPPPDWIGQLANYLASQRALPSLAADAVFGAAALPSGLW